jgi:hypothetical protein
MMRITILLTALAVALWALAPPAYAYLDPGTGNMLLQSIVGGLAVMAGVIAHYWRGARRRLSWRRPSESDKTDLGA